jgi:heme/copper-type cytochrome/quinol oxidase subunit 2
MRGQFQVALFACVLSSWMISESQVPSASPRIIELTADRDSRYRQGQKASPTIEVFADEPLILRITAVAAKEVARDGSVHGLALLDKNSDAVAGWKFFLKPGIQELAVIAPAEPGRYVAVCTVICSDGHESMGFTLLVLPRINAKERR